MYPDLPDVLLSVLASTKKSTARLHAEISSQYGPSTPCLRTVRRALEHLELRGYVTCDRRDTMFGWSRAPKPFRLPNRRRAISCARPGVLDGTCAAGLRGIEP